MNLIKTVGIIKGYPRYYLCNPLKRLHTYSLGTPKYMSAINQLIAAK